jgi:hypothetical protein
MALGSTQPLTEMSTRNHSGGAGRPARKADNLIATDCVENVVPSTSHNSLGPHGLLEGWIYLLLCRSRSFCWTLHECVQAFSIQQEIQILFGML